MHEMLPSANIISVSSLRSFVLAILQRGGRRISVLSQRLVVCVATEEQSKAQKANKMVEH